MSVTPAQSSAWTRAIIPDKENREKDDFYPTPPIGTEALLAVESFKGDIWEPACGDGAISEVLKAAGYTVISTDLVDRGYGVPGRDFLMEFGQSPPNIVTNPPFKLAEDFIWHALGLLSTKKVAMLARLVFLEGEKRRWLFESTPLARVWVFSKRLPIWRRGEVTGATGMIAFAWFVWEHGYEGPPTLGWLKT